MWPSEGCTASELLDATPFSTSRMAVWWKSRGCLWQWQRRRLPGRRRSLAGAAKVRRKKLSAPLSGITCRSTLVILTRRRMDNDRQPGRGAKPVFVDRSLVCMPSRQSISQSSLLAVSTQYSQGMRMIRTLPAVRSSLDYDHNQLCLVALFRLCSIRAHIFSNRHHQYIDAINRVFTSITLLFFPQIPLGDKHSVDGPGLLSSRDQRAERRLVRASRQGISVLRVHHRPSGSDEPTGVTAVLSYELPKYIFTGARNIAILHLTSLDHHCLI